MIRYLIMFFAFAFLFENVHSQFPERIKYQAVARDSFGNFVSDQQIAIKLSILRGGVNGPISYSEIHQVQTNVLGIVNIEIGAGLIQVGSLDTIQWGSSIFFLKTEIDLNGGINFTLSGTSQLVSVPYAMFAKQASAFNVPLLTQGQIDDLTPSAGIIVFNVSTDKLQLWNGFAWIVFSGSCEPLPTVSDAGPDKTVNDTVLNLEGNTPIVGTGTWIVINGNGGIISDTGNPTSVFYGIPGEEYTLIWKISSYCGQTADTVVITINQVAGSACQGVSSVEYQGKTYTTVAIGSQCWFKENLDVGVMIWSSNAQTDNGVIEKYCYSNDTAYCNTYGGLYKWEELMNYNYVEGTQGICPVGWHIPSDYEFCQLASYMDSTVDCNGLGWLGTNSGGKLKEVGTAHWLSPNTGATNESGFTGLGAGYWSNFSGSGNFYSFNVTGSFWTSSMVSTAIAWDYYLYYTNSKIYRQQLSTTHHNSLRCIKD